MMQIEWIFTHEMEMESVQYGVAIDKKTTHGVGAMPPSPWVGYGYYGVAINEL